MKTWVFGIIFLISLQSWSQSVCAPLLNYCSYYTCVARDLGCSNSNYLLSFGKKYCSRFESRENRFSSHGQKFLEKVSVCLRQKIEAHYEKLSCSNVKSYSASSHVGCYVASGFCRLSFGDKLEILHTVLKPALFDPTFQRVAHRLTKVCF